MRYRLGTLAVLALAGALLFGAPITAKAIYVQMPHSGNRCNSGYGYTTYQGQQRCIK